MTKKELFTSIILNLVIGAIVGSVTFVIIEFFFSDDPGFFAISFLFAGIITTLRFLYTAGKSLFKFIFYKYTNEIEDKEIRTINKSDIAEIDRLREIILDQSKSFESRQIALDKFTEMMPELKENLITLSVAEKNLKDISKFSHLIVGKISLKD